MALLTAIDLLQPLTIVCVMLEGITSEGAIVSFTVTVIVAVPTLFDESVSVYVIVVTPLLNVRGCGTWPLKLPVVATHPIQFQTPDDFEAHEARTCIAEGETLGNPKRIKRFTREQHFKTTAEMTALFADIPSAIANTVAIARRCALTLVLGKPQLPNFPTPIMPNGEPQPMEDYFRELSHQGLEERLLHLFPTEDERNAQRPIYVERLDFEINTILKMGFPGYFLIVQDFINWAKNNGCPVGPGRGSGAGSLVAYALKITDLDPLKYNLLFERFLNPERVSMPDFDIDFCQGNRDRVIEYVKDKYGRPAVSQIATFGTMAARAAIRDVGRVLDMSYTFCDGISKLIPNKPGQHITIAGALEGTQLGVRSIAIPVHNAQGEVVAAMSAWTSQRSAAFVATAQQQLSGRQQEQLQHHARQQAVRQQQVVG